MSKGAVSSLLRAENIWKVFEKNNAKLEILKGVSLEVGEGELLGIVGASGAGKSTLLHILGTLEAPTRGKVFFDHVQKSIFEYNDQEISKFRNLSLGFVFQFHHLIPELSAVENVMMPALIAGHSFRDAEKQSKELLAFVGLKDRFSHFPGELSGGEQQRIAIARAVVLRPKMVLADELTGNLDTANRNQVMQLLRALNKETGIAVVVVSHDPEVAKQMDRVLVMKDGMLVQN